jgi:hypothetical protein
MPDLAPDLIIAEGRTVRRLFRLFRWERIGAYARRPMATVWRLIERRGALLAELSRLDRRRRALAVPPSPELDAALRGLHRETELSRERAEQVVAATHGELCVRRGADSATGLRDRSADSRLLGRG